MRKVVVLLLAVFVLILGLFLSRGIRHVDKDEFGFVYDSFTGDIEKIEHSGWVTRNPVRFSVHKIYSKPFQVEISADHHILAAKVVRFNPSGLDSFVNLHGRKSGHYDRLKEILRYYAFDNDQGKNCPFLIVVSELVDPTQGNRNTQ